MIDRQLTILAIDDDPEDAELLRRQLEQVPELHFAFMHCVNPDEGIKRASGQGVDVIFVDFFLPGRQGDEVVKALREADVDRPIVAFTGLGHEYIAKDLIQAGADDHIAKGDLQPDTLRRSIQYVWLRYKERQVEAKFAHARERAAQHVADANIELSQMSRSDALTRLMNRRAWDEAATMEHERSSRHSRVYSILMIDVDYFKKFNDTRGHQAGDQCLQHVAQCLREACRATDFIGRYGGEEFVVLVPETGIDGAQVLGNRIRETVWSCNLPHPASEVADRVTVSIGAATAPANRWEEVVQRADQALYQAKAHGRNRVWAETDPEAPDAGESAAGPLTIVAIDDDEGDAEILRRQLQLIPDLDFKFIHRIDPESGRAELAQRPTALLFLDYQLGAKTGLEILKLLRSDGYLGPIVVVTGQGSEYVAADLTRAGADDYVAKSDLRPEVLQRAINNALAQQSRRQVEAQNKRLLAELQMTKKALEAKNTRLAELYETAHQFVDNVSHEFRTPLTVMKEFTAIIRDGLAGEVNEEQREYLEIVLNRIDDLSTMVDDMLDISKLEADVLRVSRRECQIEEIILNVRTTLERKALARKVSLDFAIDDSLPAVYCDPEKAGRVIINLAVNALKFCSEGGHVDVWARKGADASQLTIGVTDNGPGIAPENVQAIFERFKQIEGSARASTKGFGLGLNIAKELVHLNFGEITVESQVGQGSTFSFTVPVAEPTKVLESYFRCIGSPSVALLEATVDPEVGPESLHGVDEFLQGQLRRCDVMFRVKGDRWLIIAATKEDEAGLMINRLEEACRDANRNRPVGKLPAVKIGVRETCRCEDERVGFIERFEIQYSAGTLCTASC